MLREVYLHLDLNGLSALKCKAISNIKEVFLAHINLKKEHIIQHRFSTLIFALLASNKVICSEQCSLCESPNFGSPFRTLML